MLSSDGLDAVALRHLFAHAPVAMGLVELHDDGVLHVVGNQAAARFLDGTPADAEAGVAGHFVRERDDASGLTGLLVRHCAEAYAERRPVRFRHEHPAASGPRHLAVTVRFVALGEADRPRFTYTIDDQTTEMRAAREVEAGQARFEAIFNSMFQFIGLMDPDGTLLEANETALAFAALQPEDVVGKPFWECHWWQASEATREHLRAEVARAATGAFVRYNAEVLGAEGRLATIDFSIKPVFDDAGEVVLLIPEGRDVTEQVEMQAALETTERRLRTVLGHAPLVLFATDADGTFTLSDGQGLDALGLAPGDLDGQNVFDVYAGNSAIVEGLRRVLDGEATRYTTEVDAIVFEVHAFPTFDGGGGVDGLIGIGLDVTDRATAQRDLEARATRSMLLYDIAARDGLGYDDHIRYALEETTRLLGLEFGLVSRIEVPPLEADAVYTVDVSHARTRTALPPGPQFPLDETYCALVWGEPGVVTIDHMAASEHREAACYGTFGLEAFIGVTFRVNGRPYGTLSFSSPTPRPEGFAEADRDLVQLLAQWIGTTIEQREAERSLQDARDRAEAASRAKSAFLAAMSHEIRTPMNSVIGFAELLGMTDLSAQQQGYVDRVVRSGEHLLTLIEDLLDFSKIEAGEMQLADEPFALEPLVRGVLETLAPQAASKQLHLAYDLADSVPARLLGDAQRLKQILLNLVGNAVKFTDAGRIEVEVDTAGIGDQARLHVRVVDTGIGMDEDAVARVFRAFTQADISTTRRYGGTGLGLAISSRLAALMQGALRVESAPGRGSTFTLDVPLRPARTTRRVVVGAAPTPLGGRTVLLVDDDAASRALLGERLRGWGMQVRAVERADEALALLEAGPAFDLCLLDMVMPEMNGLDLAHRIRALPGADALPLLVVSSGAERTHAPGLVDAVLMKPLDWGALYERIVHALERRRMRLGEAPPAPALVAPRLRVLVAEDQPDNQFVAINMLQVLGADVVIANDGQEAVEQVEQGEFDVVLMDVMMPRLDGVEAAKLIRDRVARERQPRIVALTAHALAEERHRCLAAGMDDFVTKPYSLEQLATALRVAPLGGTVGRA